jgi:hypothetical protein
MPVRADGHGNGAGTGVGLHGNCSIIVFQIAEFALRSPEINHRISSSRLRGPRLYATVLVPLVDGSCGSGNGIKVQNACCWRILTSTCPTT